MMRKKHVRAMRVVAGIAAMLGACALGAGETAAESDMPLPLPIGIGITGHWQDQGYDIVELCVNDVVLINGDGIEVGGLDINNTVYEVNLKADWWALPFLNVFALMGRVQGRTEVNLNAQTILDLADFLGDFPLEEALEHFQVVEYEGLVYGGGATLTAGLRGYFAALNATYTDTKLDTTKASVRAWVLTPKVGIVTRYGALYAGAMYQRTDEKHEVTFGEFEFDVELAQREEWNYTLGLATGFSKNVSVEVEGGFGDRKHANITVAYRF